jgi:hypothetical protein
MPAISGQMCAALDFGALLFNGTTNSSLCGVAVSITTEPALVVDADGLLGPPPVNRRRAGAAYNVTFTFSEPIRPAVLLMEGVDAQVQAGRVLAANLPGGALNITSNTTQLVAAPPTAAPTTTAATTTSATTAETANATTDGTESTTTTAATEAPVAEMLPVSITTLTLQIDDSNVRFKSISVQKPFAATTATVLTSVGGSTATIVTAEKEEEGVPGWAIGVAVAGGVLLVILVIVLIVCASKGKSSARTVSTKSQPAVEMQPKASPEASDVGSANGGASASTASSIYARSAVEFRVDDASDNYRAFTAQEAGESHYARTGDEFRVADTAHYELVSDI